MRHEVYRSYINFPRLLISYLDQHHLCKLGVGKILFYLNIVINHIIYQANCQPKNNPS